MSRTINMWSLRSLVSLLLQFSKIVDNHEKLMVALVNVLIDDC